MSAATFKGTPGPWQIRGTEIVGRNAYVCEIYPLAASVAHEKAAPANAALIEQAPAMLEALRHALAFVCTYTGDGVPAGFLTAEEWALLEPQGQGMGIDTQGIRERGLAIIKALREGGAL